MAEYEASIITSGQPCSLPVAFVAEFVGSTLYMYCGMMPYLLHGYYDAGPIITAFSIGLGVMAILQIYAHITPVRLNPAVNVAMFILGRMDWLKMLLYIVAEYAGGLAGYSLLKLCQPDEYAHPALLRLNPTLTVTQGFFVEFIASLMLMLALTGISMRISLHHADSMPLAVGLIVAGFLVATEPFTGGCMNPMRSLPPCIYENDWKDHWVFHLAPYGGMMTGAIMYRAIFDKDFKYSLYNVKMLSYPVQAKDESVA